MQSPKILTLDIETSPIEGIFWRLGEQRVGLEQIERDWSILSYRAKWLGSKKMIYQDTSGRGPAKVRDDSRLLTGLHALLDEADIVIAQNGKRFDIRKIRARLIEAGYKPFSPIRIIDTYREADKLADFTSHKLEWLSLKLAKTQKDKHREFPGKELWRECLKDNPKAWAVMRKYNPTDVIATEEVYLVLRPWIENHPNLAVYGGPPEACGVCGGKTKWSGYYHTQQGKYHRTECTKCGKWGRDKQNLLTKAERAALKVG